VPASASVFSLSDRFPTRAPKRLKPKLVDLQPRLIGFSLQVADPRSGDSQRGLKIVARGADKEDQAAA
jgi:hypothetical protein